MKASDFVKKYSIRLAVEADLKIYQDFIKKHSMSTSALTLNLVRKESLALSFAEQGLSAFPIFLLDDKNEICGFFCLGVRNALLNGKKITYGYLSDLRLNTQKVNRTLVEFRKIYRDIIESFSQIEEFKEVNFFLTSVLGENQDALKALSRGRSGIVYKYLDSLNTQVLWVHAGYLFADTKEYAVSFSEVDSQIRPDSDGLCEEPVAIANVGDLQFKVEKQGKILFSGIFSKPNLRKFEVGFNFWDKGSFTFSSSWMINVYKDPSLTDKEYSTVVKSLVKELLRLKKIKQGSLLLFKTDLQNLNLKFSKKVTTQIFEVHTSDAEGYAALKDQKVKLDPFFL